MTQAVTLFVGTRRGLFRVRTDARHTEWHIGSSQIEGHEIAHVCADPTEPTRLYAGIDPAGLFFSDDGGGSWQPVEALNEHPTNRFWEPSKGIFAVNSVCVDPCDPRSMFAAVSAGGVYRSTDGGLSWHAANRGVRAENIPGDNPEAGHNVHRLILHPGGRLYRQCYSGVYRSDDGACSWLEITGDVPSDYGFAIAANGDDADTLFRIPMSNSHMRATVDGRLRVYRSDDGGLTGVPAYPNGMPMSAYSGRLWTLWRATHAGYISVPTAGTYSPAVMPGTVGRWRPAFCPPYRAYWPSKYD